jgi:hypothetical protein
MRKPHHDFLGRMTEHGQAFNAQMKPSQCCYGDHNEDPWHKQSMAIAMPGSQGPVRDSYEARADGYPKFKGTGGELQAIIKVKAKTWEAVQTAVEMQEAAQMIAWIMDDQKRPEIALPDR